jgi:hypothetical protein
MTTEELIESIVEFLIHQPPGAWETVTALYLDEPSRIFFRVRKDGVAIDINRDSRITKIHFSEIAYFTLNPGDARRLTALRDALVRRQEELAHL